jgi:hypothetical protein
LLLQHRVYFHTWLASAVHILFTHHAVAAVFCYYVLPQRPFYFHTDESKLASLFSAVSNAGIKPKPVVFPAV